MYPIGIRLLESRVGVKGDCRLLVSDLSLPGGHQDDAVGGTRSIDSCRCSVLEDVDGLDVGRVEGVKAVHAAGHTVDNDERAGGTGRTETADCDIVSCSRSTARLDDVYARDGAIDGTECIRCTLFKDIVTGDIENAKKVAESVLK